jgi:hypothetical protein
MKKSIILIMAAFMAMPMVSMADNKPAKKKKGEVVAEAWIVKCVAIYNEVWDEEE